MQKEIDTKLEYEIEGAIRDYFESDIVKIDYEVETPDGTSWLMFEDDMLEYVASEIKDAIMEVLLND